MAELLSERTITEPSNREKEILQWAFRGYTYQEIANKLFIDKTTVTTHINNAISKLNVSGVRQAIYEALQKGFISIV